MIAQSDRVEDQAAEWADALHQRGDDPELRRMFERWRDHDPERAETYDRIDRGYRIVQAIEGSETQQKLLRETRARVAKRRRRQYSIGIAASLAVATVAGFVVSADLRDEALFQQQRLVHALNGESLYRTAVGEQRSIELPGGSEMTLNTDSRAVVAYGDDLRGVTLARGQALFDVAPNPNRPFVVTAGNRKVTALGTKFDVRMTGKRLEVTLIEGKVSVEDGERPAPQSTQRTTNNEQRSFRSDSKGRQGRDGRSPKGAAHGRAASTTILRPGEQLIATANLAKPVIRQADIRRAISWREGLLLFEDENLASAISEVNRYNARHIVLTDDALRDLRISGAFRAGQPESFLETIALYLPIRIVESTDNRILVGRRG